MSCKVFLSRECNSVYYEHSGSLRLSEGHFQLNSCLIVLFDGLSQCTKGLKVSVSLVLKVFWLLKVLGSNTGYAFSISRLLFVIGNSVIFRAWRIWCYVGNTSIINLQSMGIWSELFVIMWPFELKGMGFFLAVHQKPQIVSVPTPLVTLQPSCEGLGSWTRGFLSCPQLQSLALSPRCSLITVTWKKVKVFMILCVTGLLQEPLALVRYHAGVKTSKAVSVICSERL